MKKYRVSAIRAEYYLETEIKANSSQEAKSIYIEKMCLGDIPVTGSNILSVQVDGRIQ